MDNFSEVLCECVCVHTLVCVRERAFMHEDFQMRILNLDVEILALDRCQIARKCDVCNYNSFQTSEEKTAVQAVNRLLSGFFCFSTASK